MTVVEGFRTTGRWMGDPARPLLGWLTLPAGTRSSGAALILPPLGYEYATTHRTLRTLAESIATAGWAALRLDYDGTGDSAGDQWDADRVAAWRGSVSVGAGELRGLGYEDIVVIGLRAGATFALLEAHAVNAAGVVAWAPVISGRRYVRELRMLGMPVEPSPVLAEPDGAISFAGTVFDAATLRDLSALDLGKLDAPPAPSVLVVEQPDHPASSALVERLGELVSAVDARAVDGGQLCLDVPAEYATVPDAIVREIAGWVTSTHSSSAPQPAAAAHEPRDRADFEWDGAPITELVTSFTARGLVGIVGAPGAAPDAVRATVVFANPGSETHIGPGRAWVEYSRRLNRAGFRTIRLDSRGWGESPDDGRAPARPYDAHMATDLVEVVADIEARGWGPVVLAGLCAGAWMALDVARSTTLGGVIAFNPQLYWQPGDIVEANIHTETHVRREAERQRIKRLGNYGVWSLLDAFGARNAAARTLDDIVARDTPTLLVFSPGDDGLEYLEDRLGRSLARWQRGSIQIAGLPSIDHGMHRSWRRTEVIDAMLGFLGAIAPA